MTYEDIVCLICKHIAKKNYFKNSLCFYKLKLDMTVGMKSSKFEIFRVCTVERCPIDEEGKFLALTIREDFTNFEIIYEKFIEAYNLDNLLDSVNDNNVIL